MNRDEVIELAEKAGFVEYELDDGTLDSLDIRYIRFAALVEERCIQRMYDNTDNMHDEQAMTMKAIFSDAIRGKAY